MSVPKLRAAYYESLYQPEYIPAVEGRPVLAASGDVWLASTEAADTFSVYYVVDRGTANEPPRRVLLPEGMYVTDATSTMCGGFCATKRVCRTSSGDDSWSGVPSPRTDRFARAGRRTDDRHGSEREPRMPHEGLA